MPIAVINATNAVTASGAGDFVNAVITASIGLLPVLVISIAILIGGIVLIRKSRSGDITVESRGSDVSGWQLGTVTFSTAFSSDKPKDNGQASPVIATVIGHRPLETGGFVPMLEYAENGKLMRDELPPITVPPAGANGMQRFQMAPGQESEWVVRTRKAFDAPDAGNGEKAWGGSPSRSMEPNPFTSNGSGYGQTQPSQGEGRSAEGVWHPTREEMEAIMPTGTQVPLRKAENGGKTVSSHAEVPLGKVFGILLTVLGGVGIGMFLLSAILAVAVFGR